MNELLEEAISEDGGVVNFQAMHDLLEASIKEKTSESEPTIDGANAENGMKSTNETSPKNGEESIPGAVSPTEGAPTTESDVTGDHYKTDAEPEVKKIDPSLVGWTTKSDCCQDFNQKLFGSQTETGGVTRISEVKKDIPILPKERDTFSTEVDTIVDKVDDFVNDTSKEVTRIDNRVKGLEVPVKKVDWTEDL